MSMFRYIVMFMLLTNDVIGDKQEWELPHAWGRAKPGGQIITPHHTNSDIQLHDQSSPGDFDHIKLYYVKLLKFLFDRRKMSLDKSSEYYIRSLNFRVTEDQLNILQHSKNPRDLDSIASEILSDTSQSECQCHHGIFTKAVSLFQVCWRMLLDSSDLRLGSIFLGALLAIFYIKRKYKYGIVSILLCICVMWGYYKAYKNCLKEMEAEELIRELFKGSNPCDELKPNPIGKFFFGQDYYRHQCIQHLKNQNKEFLCDPGHVFLRYLNEVFFNQVFLLVENSVDVIQKSTTKFAWPFNYMAMIVVGLFLFHFMKFCIKYLFLSMNHAWASSGGPRTINASFRSTSQDQLTGENLTLLLQRLNPSQPEVKIISMHTPKSAPEEKPLPDTSKRSHKKSLLAAQPNNKYKLLMKSNSSSVLRRGSF